VRWHRFSLSPTDPLPPFPGATGVPYLLTEGDQITAASRVTLAGRQPAYGGTARKYHVTDIMFTLGQVLPLGMYDCAQPQLVRASRKWLTPTSMITRSRLPISRSTSCRSRARLPY